MNIQIRYYTKSGNTEKLAKAVESALSVKAESIEKPLDEKADILFLGCSYYAFDMDESVKNFLRDNKDKIGKIACFGTSAMMKSMKKPLKKVLGEFGATIIDAEFHCHGSFGPMHKGKPDEKDLEAVRRFSENVVSEMK